MTQPGTDGSITNYSWGEVGDQARRMAAHLLSLNLPPKSTIAIVGKNSAPWIISDLAAWLAGFITVPLYPTTGAERSAERRVGKECVRTCRSRRSPEH